MTRRDASACSVLSGADDDERRMSGFILAARASALDPERTVYLISRKSSVLDSVLNQTHEPNAVVLIKDSGLQGRAANSVVKASPGVSCLPRSIVCTFHREAASLLCIANLPEHATYCINSPANYCY